jgi:lambda repressor-like predicted transcriptional regulator
VYELKSDMQEASIRLREKGWSCRAIARDLGFDRETVGRHLRLAAKPATERNRLIIKIGRGGEI